jgi:hypothetical protein
MSDATDEEMVEFSIEVTPAVADQVEAAASLTGQRPEELVETSVLNRLQAIDNILHGEEHIEIPPGFDIEAWQRRYDRIRREVLADAHE